MGNQFQEIWELLSNRQRFVVCCHVHPDGDAIGSLLAVGLTLSKLGKQVAMVCQDGVPTVYNFLEGSEEIRQELDQSFRPEVIICVDCAEKDRIAIDPEIWGQSDLFLLNLDHHLTNAGFGDLNLVDPSASATGEVVYGLLTEFGIELEYPVALALYTAIATDTGFFRYESTSSYTLEIASSLVKDYGVKPDRVAELVHEQKSYNSLRLLGEVLSGLKLSENGKVAWLILDQPKLKKFPVENEETESYVNYARSIEGVEIGILFKELEPGEVKLSWRSTTNVDVSKLAGHFGGGGHARAAGCTINGSIDTVVDQVLDYVNQLYEA